MFKSPTLLFSHSIASSTSSSFLLWRTTITTPYCPVKHRTTDRQRTDTLPRPSCAKNKERKAWANTISQKKQAAWPFFFVDNPDWTFILRPLFFFSLFFFFFFSSSPLHSHSHNGLPPCCFPPPWPRQGKPISFHLNPLITTCHPLLQSSSLRLTTPSIVRLLILEDDLLSRKKKDINLALPHLVFSQLKQVATRHNNTFAASAIRAYSTKPQVRFFLRLLVTSTIIEIVRLCIDLLS